MGHSWPFVERACIILGLFIAAATLYFTAGAYYGWNHFTSVMPSASNVGGATMILSWWVYILGGIGGLLLITAWAMIVVRTRGLWRRQYPLTDLEPPAKPLIEPADHPPSTQQSSIEQSSVRSHAVAHGTYPGRDFVSASITPEYLIGLFQGHTGIQANKLTEAYVGKWLKLSGSLDQVDSLGSDNALVIFSGNIGRSLSSVKMTFSSKVWVDRLSVLRRGDNITVIGKIERLDSFDVRLSECELVGFDSK